MVKKLCFLFIVIVVCFLLNSCYGNPDALNYGDFDIINYNGNKYYRYKGPDIYGFWGEYKVIGRYTSNWTAKGDVHILESDIEENIAFSYYSYSYFWIKEGYEFIDGNDQVKQIIISKSTINGYDDVEFSFEIEDFTINKIYSNTTKVLDWSYGKDYIVYFDYGNGIVREILVCEDSNNDYYIAKSEEWDEDYDWYKISDQYMGIFREKLKEYEEKKLVE